MRKKLVPYDRAGTDPSLGVGSDPGAVPQFAAPPPQGPQGGGGMDLSSIIGQQQPDLSALGAQGQPQGQMPDLGQGQPDLSQGVDTGGEDQAIQDMLDALANPDTPPEIRDAINAQIALAARRRLAGAGGLS